jgi:hypothetical protein
MSRRSAFGKEVLSEIMVMFPDTRALMDAPSRISKLPLSRLSRSVSLVPWVSWVPSENADAVIGSLLAVGTIIGPRYGEYDEHGEYGKYGEYGEYSVSTV